jgi:hypothetical protein
VILLISVLVVHMNCLYFLGRLAPLMTRVGESHRADRRAQISMIIGPRVVLPRVLESKVMHPPRLVVI